MGLGNSSFELRHEKPRHRGTVTGRVAYLDGQLTK